MAAQKIESQEVTYPGESVEIKAFVAKPASDGPRPAVIVVQEWWGLNEHIKDVARRFAKEGYFAIAPDLYSRQGHKVTTDPNVASELMSKLTPDDGVDDLLSTMSWLGRQEDEVKDERIGVIGFCMGGSFALRLPCTTKEIAAAAPFYGEIPPDETLQQLGCPVFYAYGENDGWIARQDVDRLAAALKNFDKPGEVKVYKGCSHGFFNDTRKDVYAAAEAQDAWQKVLKLFAANLKR
jgi:carboxymethylenebutenolidase